MIYLKNKILTTFFILIILAYPKLSCQEVQNQVQSIDVQKAPSTEEQFTTDATVLNEICQETPQKLSEAEKKVLEKKNIDLLVKKFFKDNKLPVTLKSRVLEILKTIGIEASIFLPILTITYLTYRTADLLYNVQGCLLIQKHMDAPDDDKPLPIFDLKETLDTLKNDIKDKFKKSQYFEILFNKNTSKKTYLAIFGTSLAIYLTIKGIYFWGKWNANHPQINLNLLTKFTKEWEAYKATIPLEFQEKLEIAFIKHLENNKLTINETELRKMLEFTNDAKVAVPQMMNSLIQEFQTKAFQPF